MDSSSLIHARIPKCEVDLSLGFQEVELVRRSGFSQEPSRWTFRDPKHDAYGDRPAEMFEVLSGDLTLDEERGCPRTEPKVSWIEELSQVRAEIVLSLRAKDVDLPIEEPSEEVKMILRRLIKETEDEQGRRDV